MKKLSEWNKENKIKIKNNDMNIIDINGSKRSSYNSNNDEMIIIVIIIIILINKWINK